MSVSLGKLPGVESAKISLNQGRASIALRPNNAVTLEQVARVVKDKGFTLREARVMARGEFAETAGQLQFKLLNTNRIYDLLFTAKALKSNADARRNVGKPLLVEGIIPPPSAKTPSPLQVLDFRPIR